MADGHSVLVAAPTGAGKTVVGEFAVAHAQRRGRKAYYTTPIKALSNQKFGDLRAIYGPERVGLLTGDTSINPHADIVVMTTEVLRNMIYAGSSSLDSLGVVVLDEVHYLADRFRGSVWEEVIVHVGAATSIVSLSATVSNAEEFGAWLTEVRGDTRVIVSERRPVPLWPHVHASRGHLRPLRAGHRSQRPRTATRGSIPNSKRWSSGPATTSREVGPRDTVTVARGAANPSRGAARRGSPSSNNWMPKACLPAIVFVFSRAGCEDAVEQVQGIGDTPHLGRGASPDLADRRDPLRGAAPRGPGAAGLRGVA